MSYMLPSIFLILTIIVLSYNLFDYGNLHSAYAVSVSTITQMNDSVSSTGSSVYSDRQIQVEYVNSSSILVGKPMDTITVQLQKSGSPTGTVQVGVFNSDLSVKQLFGTIDASTIATEYASYSFSLPPPQTYQIQPGDRIGIKFAGGNSSNYVAIMTDTTNSFDDTDSYLSCHVTNWNALTGKDLTMILKLHVYDLTVSASPSTGKYNSTKLVTLSTSVPFTIFYTTDGSTPTTSSAKGTSPVSIIVNSNSTLKFFAKDNLGNTSPVGSAQYTIIYPVVTRMSDTVSSTGSSTFPARPLQAEYVSSTSSLVGKSVDTITVKLRKNDSPTGTVQVGVFNSDLSVKQLFGTIDSSTITSGYTSYSFSLPSSQIYQIQSGDLIGIKFARGDSSNYINIMTDTTNSFDHANSYLTWYETSWQPYTGEDLTMILKSHVYSGPTISSTPPAGTYNSTKSVTLSTTVSSTVFYTTDGSTPTTSSPSGPSPVTGIIVNSNSTLKYFAKDSQANVGPMGSAVYTFVVPPTVSTLPPAGTYNSTKLITLSTTVPSTIFYTSDGSTPTTSSPSGPSPVPVIVNTNSTLRFFAKDSLGNIGPVGSAKYKIIYPIIVQMNDSVSSIGSNTYSDRQIQAEYVNRSSVLVGKPIDTITVKLHKSGSPTGTVQVGVFNSDLSVKQLFGTIDASTVATSLYTPYSFSLPVLQPYQIKSGDRIGIKFAGGDASNYIGLMTDTTNSFDGTNSDLSYHTTSWQNSTAKDITMILESHVSPPTVSASPPGGTYNYTKSVTLSTTVPSTIFYTSDGSTPTTSSASGSSPVLVTVSTNSTLKFFAKDSLGNMGPMGSAVYTIHFPPAFDRFGIKEIHPTIPGGVQWTSNFDNGVVRSFGDADHKEGDPWLDVNHGDGTFFIDGKGKMVANGSPRIYVHNPDGVTEWKENLEITMYHIRINETQIVSYSGTQIFAHTNHGVGYDESTYLCPDRGYGAKPNDAGQWAFEKETAHHKSNGYADSYVIPGGSVQFFPNGMPRNTPIGVKYIIYQLPANQMKLELWADLTDGANGGDWKKVVQVIDTGKNWGVGYDTCMSGVDPAKVLTKVLTQPDSPNIPVDVSVYFRHEYAAMAYEKMSIREIDPSITN